MFVSTDARTFKEPPAEWKPAPTGATTGGQSLIGDLIREGITGVTGNVAEPLLDSVVKPQVLFPAYLSGFNLAESFYLALPFLSWQQVVIGDPLCAPFMTSALKDDQIHQGMDPETDLPRLFSSRRLAALSASKFNPQALKLVMHAQSLAAQGRPLAESHVLLDKAVTLEPRLTDAQLQLASAAEERKDFDAAITRYRAILAVEPSHIVALNNLAYLLADQKNQAKDALPLAERAYQLSRQAAVVADTLAWVHYKLGNAQAALPLIERAFQQAPKNADIALHAAEIQLAAGNLPQARISLDTALKLDPGLAERPDVKALVARIR
jgi:tetratricopeptide (TPR) repeat protein